jgi:hypothetical protein
MTHIVNIVRKVDELVKEVLVGSFPTKEQKWFNLLAAIKFIAHSYTTTLVNVSDRLLILLLIKRVTRSIFVQIVVCEHADIREIIAMVTSMQNSAEEHDKFELVIEIESLCERQVPVLLVALQIL